LKFKIDENLPSEFAAALIEAGFAAATIGEQALSGAPDSALLDRCRAESRVLVTLDLDFANAQAHPLGTQSGIIVFRCKSQDKLTLLLLLRRILPVFKSRSPQGQLWIVQADRIRYRQE